MLAALDADLEEKSVSSAVSQRAVAGAQSFRVKWIAFRIRVGEHTNGWFVYQRLGVIAHCMKRLCQFVMLLGSFLMYALLSGCVHSTATAVSSPKFVLVAHCHGHEAQVAAGRIVRSLHNARHTLVFGSDEGEVITVESEADIVRAALSEAVAKKGLNITVIEK
jgi:hypothetical protein